MLDILDIDFLRKDFYIMIPKNNRNFLIFFLADLYFSLCDFVYFSLCDFVYFSPAWFCLFFPCVILSIFPLCDFVYFSPVWFCLFFPCVIFSNFSLCDFVDEPEVPFKIFWRFDAPCSTLTLLYAEENFFKIYLYHLIVFDVVKVKCQWRTVVEKGCFST